MLFKPVPPLSLIKYKQSTSPLVLYHMLSLIFQFAIIHKFMIPAPYHAAVTTLVFYCLNFVLSIQLEFKNQSTPLAVFLENFMFYFLFNLIKSVLMYLVLLEHTSYLQNSSNWMLIPTSFVLLVHISYLQNSSSWILIPTFFVLLEHTSYLQNSSNWMLIPTSLVLWS